MTLLTMIPGASGATAVAGMRDAATVALHALGARLAAELPLLGDVAVKGTLVLTAALAASVLLRRASAAVRHLVWISAIATALAIPLLGRVAPRWEALAIPDAVTAAINEPTSAGDPTPAVPVTTVSEPISAPRSTAGPSSPRADLRATPATASRQHGAESANYVATSTTTAVEPSARATTPPLSLAEWLGLVWLAGAILVLARLALGTAFVWRAARSAEPMTDADWVMPAQRLARELHITRPVTLLTSARQSVPVTWGVVYPVILLPEEALEWEDERRTAVLVHELAHVRRLDAFTQLLVQLAVAVLWFHPLAWIAARHVRTERERACDDLVLSYGTRASFYADDLLRIVRTLRPTNQETAFAALAMARPTELEGRLLAILDPRVSRRHSGWRGVLLAMVMSAGIALPLAALRPLPRKSSPPTAPERGAPAMAVAGPGSVAGATAPARTPDTSVHTASASGGSSELTCKLRNGRQVSMTENDGGSNFLLSDDTHCISMVHTGRVTFTDDDAAVQSISPGAHVSITEVTQSQTRRYTAEPSGDGLSEQFYVGDQRVADDASSREWLHGVIRQIVRQDADLAPARAQRIRTRSGVPGVLAEIHDLKGDYIKTAYLDALLGEGGMTSDSVHLITTAGTSELTSDYYKSEFLGRVARLSRDATTAASLAGAARSIQSDYYRRQVLSSALAGDGDRRAVAHQVIDVTTGMTSDYDRSQVLEDLLGRGTLGNDLTVELINSASGISSDYYRAVVLDSVVATQSVSARPVYTALLQAAKGITSDYYRSQVLTNLLQRSGVTPDAVAATLRSVGDMESATYKANVLLAAAATPAIRNQSVRDAYFAAAKTLGDGTEARRAMTAVLP